MAEFLWGRQRVEALDGSAGVDWRASAGNVKTLTDFAAQLRDAPGTSAEMKRWIDETVAGITAAHAKGDALWRSEEHTSELQSLMRISYAVFCLKKKKNQQK